VDLATYSWKLYCGVTVSDAGGRSASDSVAVEVRDGRLLVRTGSGLFAVDMEGNSFLFNTTAANVEVLGTRIFAGRSTIAELDHQGNVIASIPVPPEVPASYNFVVLPDAGFAFLDNETDTISFIDSQGNFITKLEMPEHDLDHNQTVDGIVVGNRLIVSENGVRELVEVDLSTHVAGIYRDLGQIGGWIGHLDYSNGIFYICQCTGAYTFTEDSDPVELFAVDAGCLSGIVVVGSYAYTVVNSPGKIYRTNIKTGETETFLEGLNYPQDIEFIGAPLGD
jgi:DNA-binding beta-propeller fold protein YncE